MGGSKTKTAQKTTTEIPAEIRERGTAISNAAMGQYFDPSQKYTNFNSSDPNFQNYQSVGQNTTGQLNNFHTAAGNNYTSAGSSYQPFFNAAGSQANSAQQYGGPTGGAQGYAGNAQTAQGISGNTNVNQGSTAPTNTASGFTGNAGTAQGPNFTAQNIARFQNPFQQGVIDQGVRDIGENLNLQRLNNQSQAANAGAFGGARHGVIDAQSQQTAARTMSDFIGQQLNTGYDKAVSQYNTDLSQTNSAAGQNFNQQLAALGLNNQAAGQNFNQNITSTEQGNKAKQQNLMNQVEFNKLNNSAAGQNFSQQLQALGLGNQATGQNFTQGLAALGLNNQAAGQNYAQQLGLGQATQGANLAAGNANLNFGNVVTQQEQAQKDNAYNKGYLDQRGYPMDIYERLAGINAMQPVNRTSTSTGSQSQSGGWLGPALGAAGSIFASDERTKENISDVDPEDILGAFAQITPKSYTYKDEFLKSHPDITKPGPRTGFMAQDMERAFRKPSGPTLGGVKTVDVAEVMGNLVAAVTGLERRTRGLAPKRRA